MATAPKSSLLILSLINLTNPENAIYEQKAVHTQRQPLVARRDSLKRPLRQCDIKVHFEVVQKAKKVNQCANIAIYSYLL